VSGPDELGQKGDRGWAAVSPSFDDFERLMVTVYAAESEEGVGTKQGSKSQRIATTKKRQSSAAEAEPMIGDRVRHWYNIGVSLQS